MDGILKKEDIYEFISSGKMTYSDFTLWLDDNDDQWEEIVSYDEWSIVYIAGHYYFYDHEPEGSSDSLYEVEPIASLYYTLDNQPDDEDALITLFADYDYCGEQDNTDQLIYWWFKIIDNN